MGLRFIRSPKNEPSRRSSDGRTPTRHSELCERAEKEIARCVLVAVVDLRHDLIGKPLGGGRPAAAEPVVAADRFLRPCIPYKREDGFPPDSRMNLRDGEFLSIGQGVHDNGFRLDGRPGRAEAVACRMNLVDIVPALHFQETALENAVRNPVLMHLGSLEKPDGILRQRGLRNRETGRCDGQVGPERRRGFDVIGKIQHTADNQCGIHKKKERSVFHHVVGEHDDRAGDRADDRGADLQVEGSLRLDEKMIAQQECRTGAAQRKHRERRQRCPCPPPSAEKPYARPPERHSRQNPYHVDLPHECGAEVYTEEANSEKQRYHFSTKSPGPFPFLRGILHHRHGAGGEKKKREVKDPVRTVHGGRPPRVEGIGQGQEERDPRQECAGEAFPRQDSRDGGFGRLRGLGGFPFAGEIFVHACSPFRGHSAFFAAASGSAGSPGLTEAMEASSDFSVSGSRQPTRKKSATASTTWA